MKKKLYSDLHPMIRQLLVLSRGWLVGGSIIDVLNDKVPKDYDVLIESRETYQDTVKWLEMVCTERPMLNTFGGLKFNLEGMEVDIWCESLHHFVTSAVRLELLYNLRRGKLLKSEE